MSTVHARYSMGTAVTVSSLVQQGHSGLSLSELDREMDLGFCHNTTPRVHQKGSVHWLHLAIGRHSLFHGYIIGPQAPLALATKAKCSNTYVVMRSANVGTGSWS
jgi:hypothetical protein